jgi:hypothetical protein
LAPLQLLSQVSNRLLLQIQRCAACRQLILLLLPLALLLQQPCLPGVQLALQVWSALLGAALLVQPLRATLAGIAGAAAAALGRCCVCNHRYTSS